MSIKTKNIINYFLAFAVIGLAALIAQAVKSGPAHTLPSAGEVQVITVTVAPEVPAPVAQVAPPAKVARSAAPSSDSGEDYVDGQPITNNPVASGHDIVKVPTCDGCATMYVDRTEEAQTVTVVGSSGSWTAHVGDLAIVSCNSARTSCEVRDLRNGRTGTADGHSIYAD